MVFQLDFPNRTTLSLSTGNPFLQFPKTPYSLHPLRGAQSHPFGAVSSVPSFQHSNWGEAPKFDAATIMPVFKYLVN
jgi:hypothetical protein